MTATPDNTTLVVGGRFANLFGLAGWAAYKPFAILTVSVAAVLAYAGWALVVPRRTAVSC